MREGALSVLVVRRRDRWVDAWNRLDLLVVLLSYVSMVLEAAFASVGSGVASLRALRLLRLLRLLEACRPVISPSHGAQLGMALNHPAGNRFEATRTIKLTHAMGDKA